MPKTEWTGHQGFTKREVPKPTLDEARNPSDRDWTIVKLRYTGVCGSDRGIWFRQTFGDLIRTSLEREGSTTRTIGHELFGEIVEVGSGARANGFAPGQLVAAESHITCGICYQCQRKEFHVCTDEKILGISINGCFAEYIKLPAKVLWPTDTAKIRPEIATLQEPFGNGVHAATKVNLRGKRVAIFGCGPIGLFTVLIARAYGAERILAVDPAAGQRELAKTFGADDVFGTVQDDPAGYDTQLVADIRKATAGVGADVALEMAGYPTSVNNAVQSVRRGGDVILFGLKSGPTTIHDFDRMIVRGVTLHSVIGRELFKTWHITRALLENRSNGIQDHLWYDLLKEGKGTLFAFRDYDAATFEQALTQHPKLLLSYD
ncbi:MAG: alcohol dehydrogenase catalytic domain-containing protein [Candidatus Kerfeldbacteria bacterium]|nr:alcohol dehydrogenase catalytic domain-containing protein [Candidatus Kerfeldbacteria bacterium]